MDEILEDVDWKNKKIDALFHIAWSGKDGLSDLNVQKQFENLSITLNLFEIAEKLNIETFLFTGTMEEFSLKNIWVLIMKKILSTTDT